MNANRTGSTKVHLGKTHVMNLTWLKEVIIHLNLPNKVSFDTPQIIKKRMFGLSLTITKDKIYTEEILWEMLASIISFFLVLITRY